MVITANSSAPYAPPKSVTEVVDFHRRKGLPTPVTLDRIVMVGVSESLAPRTLQALRLLDLLDDDGNPTQAFEALRVAPEAEFRDRFADVIRGAYAEVFHYRDPASDDWTKIRDAFRTYTPYGMQERMVNLFFGLCVYAGIIDEIPRRSGTNGAKPAPVAKAKTRTKAKKDDRKAAPTPVFEFAPVPSEAAKNPFVIGLIQSLPPVGSVWPDAKREDWTKAALAAFAIIYERPPEDSIPTVKLTPSGEG
jgi:hypothetical protein